MVCFSTMSLLNRPIVARHPLEWTCISKRIQETLKRVNLSFLLGNDQSLWWCFALIANYLNVNLFPHVWMLMQMRKAWCKLILKLNILKKKSAFCEFCFLARNKDRTIFNRKSQTILETIKVHSPFIMEIIYSFRLFFQKEFAYLTNWQSWIA